LIGLETQVPYHNTKIFRAFLDFIVDWAPHEIIGIGDHLDCPAPSRWNRGTAEEYAGSLQHEIMMMKGMFGDIRRVFDGPFSVHLGNHEERINTYARTKAPAFASLDALQVSSLLAYDSFAIEERPPIMELAPGTGWVTCHGDYGGSSVYSGGTALGLARRWGSSVICGHTHRLGLLNHSLGVYANRTLTGVETGHMMDVRKAAYVKHSAPNWQSGWVAAEVTDKRVHISLVPVTASGQVVFHG